MGIIPYDSSGIPQRELYIEIMRNVHPGLLGTLKKGIDADRAAKTITLNLQDCGPVPDLEFLRYFPRLETLLFRAEGLSDLAGLAYTKELSVLNLSSDWSGMVDLSRLAECGDLRELEVSRLWLEYSSQDPVELRGMEALAGLKELKSLSLPDMEIEDIRWIRSLQNLRDVELARNPLGDLSPLTGHPTIGELDLSDCGLTSLESLGVMPELEQLYLVGNSIRDFSHLEEFPRLRYVSATCTPKEAQRWKEQLDGIAVVTLTGRRTSLRSAPLASIRSIGAQESKRRTGERASLEVRSARRPAARNALQRCSPGALRCGAVPAQKSYPA